MRIDPNFPYLDPGASEGVGNTPGQTKVSAPQTPAGSGPDATAADAGDTVRFSGTLSEAQQLKAQLSETPEVRAERVAALEQQVQQGSYHPSSEAIARAMLADFLGTGGSR